MQFAKNDVERLSEADMRRLVNAVIFRVKSTPLPEDTRNILATAVFIQLFRLLILQSRGAKDSVAYKRMQ